MVDCTRKTIFGRPACRFEARYDSKPGNIEIEGCTLSTALKLQEGSRSKTYVRDVCVKCGRTIEREAR